jgi:hypothetical protein
VVSGGEGVGGGGIEGCEGGLEEFVDVRRFGGGQCSSLSAVEWVASNLIVKYPVPEECPSPAAWALLVAYRGRVKEFFEKVWKVTLPSRTVLEERERMTDDGRGVVETVERLRRISERVDR